MRSLWLFSALAFAAVGCSQSDGARQITERTVTTSEPAAAPVASNSAERFGFQARTAPAAGAAAPEYQYVTPEGWRALPPTQFRLVNFAAGENGEIEVYFSTAGGGLVPNVNRWRKQVGLADLTAEEVAQLPKVTLLGREGVLVNWEGTYSGMQSGESKEGYRLAGVLADGDGEGLFVKMVGPAEAVEKEIDNLRTFTESLKTGAHAHAAHAGADDPHGGMSEADLAAMLAQMQLAQGDPHANMTPEQIEALQNDPSSARVSRQFAWTAPDGWEQAPDKPMREVTYNVGENAEVYVSVLGGPAGGALANINRWRGQLGVDEPLTNADVAALPTIDIMGQACPLVEVTSPDGDQALLGTVCALAERTVFVKMTGPADTVAAQKDRFVAFSESLRAVGQ